jgi:hypothetical protein
MPPRGCQKPGYPQPLVHGAFPLVNQQAEVVEHHARRNTEANGAEP